MSRVSKLAIPEFAKAVAEAYINGMSRVEMADLFEVHKDTITDWTSDPRVQAHAAKFALERVNRITRRIDTEIENRLQDTDDMDTEVLLKIRKEFLDRSLKVDLSKGADNPETINEAVNALEENPDLAKQLQDWASGAGKK